jgi:hypothetical protein
VNVPADIKGFIINSVEVDSAEGDALPGNNQDQESVQVGNVGVFLPMVYKDLNNGSVVPNPIQNGNFENGQDGSWDEYSSNGYDLIVNNFGTNMIRPLPSGDWAVWLGGLPNEVATVSQAVTIPTGNPTLTYWIWLASKEATCGNDTGKVTVNGATVEGFDLCQSTNTGDWVQHTINLSSYAGMTVTLGFNATLNATNNSNFFLDDVVIE